MNLNHSPEIKDLVAALAKAQSIMKPAVFNRINPHFKNRYADFTSCMDACRGPLSENGLAPIQYCETIDGKLQLVTMLAHTSGQWMKSEFPLVSAKMDSQGIGSAMTYAKRYSLCGMVGIVADEEADDDGEGAMGRNSAAIKIPPKQPKLSAQQIQEIRVLGEKLDQECKNKIGTWMRTAYKTERLEDLPSDSFIKVLSAFENAVRFIEQRVLEEVTSA